MDELTDEELVEIEARYWDAVHARGVDATRLLGAWIRAANRNLRLIAALRASRAEIKALKTQIREMELDDRG